MTLLRVSRSGPFPSFHHTHAHKPSESQERTYSATHPVEVCEGPDGGRRRENGEEGWGGRGIQKKEKKRE